MNRTALHEARHACAAIALRVPFSSVCLPARPKPGQPPGHARVAIPSPGASAARIAATIRVCLAPACSSPGARASRRDYAAAARLALRLAHGNRELAGWLLARLAAAQRSMMQRSGFRKAVLAVAEQLQERRYLSARRCRAIALAAVGQNKKPPAG